MNALDERETPDLTSVLRVLKEHRTQLTGKHVQHVWVFGSVARGDARADSDIDLVVEIASEAGMSLTGFSRLRQDLIDILGREVDLGEWSSFREEVVDDVKNDAVMVF